MFKVTVYVKPRMEAGRPMRRVIQMPWPEVEPSLIIRGQPLAGVTVRLSFAGRGWQYP